MPTTTPAHAGADQSAAALALRVRELELERRESAMRELIHSEARKNESRFNEQRMVALERQQMTLRLEMMRQMEALRAAITEQAMKAELERKLELVKLEMEKQVNFRLEMEKRSQSEASMQRQIDLLRVDMLQRQSAPHNGTQHQPSLVPSVPLPHPPEADWAAEVVAPPLEDRPKLRPLQSSSAQQAELPQEPESRLRRAPKPKPKPAVSGAQTRKRSSTTRGQPASGSAQPVPKPMAAPKSKPADSPPRKASQSGGLALPDGASHHFFIR